MTANRLSSGMMGAMAKSRAILIKKYENRRLYDTLNSRYVNLDEVARLLQQGDSVRVVDAISGEDITRLVLTQIIVEDAKGADSTFPLEILRQMVITSGRATQESAMRYMQTLLDVYGKSYRVMAPPFPFARPTDAAQAAGGSDPAQTSPGGRAAGDAADPDANIDELKRRVAELETLVSTLSPPAGRKAAPRKAAPRKKRSAK